MEVNNKYKNNGSSPKYYNVNCNNGEETKIGQNARCTQLCNTHSKPQPPEGVETVVSDMVQQKGNNKTTAYFYATIIAQICVILYTVVIVYFCLTGEFFIFNWHPLFMTIGWFMLMTQGILILSREEILTRYISHKLRVKLHWILQSIGAVITTAGFIVIVWNKFYANKHHFQTWHALFGLFGFICLVLTLCTGAATLYSSALKSYYSPKWNKFTHVLLGVLTYLFGGLSLLLTVYTNWFNRKSEDSSFIFTYGMICILSVITFTLVKPARYIWNRIQNF